MTNPGQTEIVTWSKDSISIRWQFDANDYQIPSESRPSSRQHQSVHPATNASSATASSGGRQLRLPLLGYEVHYQAVGSSIPQKTAVLSPSTTAFDIMHLHENTNYDICVVPIYGQSPPSSSKTRVAAASEASMTSLSHRGAPVLSSQSAAVDPLTSPIRMDSVKACVKGTTSTDSLTMALGSTFGAFLALGFIVALVFVAKWQHNRKLVKRWLAEEGDDLGPPYQVDATEMLECGIETIRRRSSDNSDGSSQDVSANRTIDMQLFPFAECSDVTASPLICRRHSLSLPELANLPSQLSAQHQRQYTQTPSRDNSDYNIRSEMLQLTAVDVVAREPSDCRRSNVDITLVVELADPYSDQVSSYVWNGSPSSPTTEESCEHSLKS